MKIAAILVSLLLIQTVTSQVRRVVKNKSSGGKNDGRRVKRIKKIQKKIKKSPELNEDLDNTAASQRFLNPFSLFNVVKFPNTECTTSLGVAGTCYTNSQCTMRGGSGSGSCAGGFGVCCTFSNECNTETSQNGTYFTNPITLSSVCSLMIKPMDDSICQVRLDLEQFNLADPDETGNCRTDYLQVTGGVANSGNLPTLCGTNAGQHLIYTAIPNFPARLSVVVDTQVTGMTRQWKIKITQFSCSGMSIAPEGCLQYFTGISGNVSSFNWKTTDNTNDPMFSNHLANQQYSVCVRRESGYCSVEWSTTMPYGAQNGHFSLSGTEQTATLTNADVEIGDSDCRNDYLQIPQGWGGTDPNNEQFGRDRFCGQALGYCTKVDCTTKDLGGVRSGVTPFVIGVVTDNDEGATTGTTTTTDSKNRGFMLNFRQHPCT